MGVPSATNLRVIPKRFIIGDTIHAVYAYSDTTSVPESGSLIRWYKNGAHQKSYDNVVSFSVTGVRDDAWTFSLTPCNGTVYGTTKVSRTGTMGNNLPTGVSYVELVPHNPSIEDDLKVFFSGAVDPDGDRVLYEIRWFRNDILLSVFNDKTTIPYTYVRAGDIFKVVVTTSDGYSESSSSESVSSESLSP